MALAKSIGLPLPITTLQVWASNRVPVLRGMCFSSLISPHSHGLRRFTEGYGLQGVRPYSQGAKTEVYARCEEC
ncbi:hypothetical protein BDV98DRAFT_568748 [Pterulicium gracile]|uniref:Uncharacterized protein n=1 Tax=Pterulicium gracile TaxID=1884261 RepID=A0A5C3QFD8_9AGAR|nr:hypothetical protein BDV98DRAFT_568748 [Pterula gracilis]